jgi:hypothetical protein
MAKLKRALHVGERSLERAHLITWLWSLRYEAMIAAGMIVTAAYTLWNHIKQSNPLLILLGSAVLFSLLMTGLNQGHKLWMRWRGVPEGVGPQHQPDAIYWPLRRLFRYLAPHLPLTAHKIMPGGGIAGDVDERWNRVGKLVLKQLSLGELHAIGQIREKRGRNPAPIPQTFWQNARFTYWFLDEGASTVWDVDSKGHYCAEIEVKGAEAVKIWPEYISLFEAATYAFEELRLCPISILTEVLSDSNRTSPIRGVKDS